MLLRAKIAQIMLYPTRAHSPSMSVGAYQGILDLMDCLVIRVQQAIIKPIMVPVAA